LPVEGDIYSRDIYDDIVKMQNKIMQIKSKKKNIYIYIKDIKMLIIVIKLIIYFVHTFRKVLTMVYIM